MDDAEWWEGDKFKKKRIYLECTGSEFPILEEPEEGTHIFCCESDKVNDLTVTEAVKKIDLIVPMRPIPVLISGVAAQLTVKLAK